MNITACSKCARESPAVQPIGRGTRSSRASLRESGKASSQLIVMLACLGLGVLLFMSFFFGAATKSPYPTMSSGLILGGNGWLGSVEPIYWIDNDRVLFGGYEVLHTTGPNGKDQPKLSSPGVYILDTRTNTFIRHADLGPEKGWDLCFNEGYIVYTIGGDPTWSNWHWEAMAGQLGQEVRLPDVYNGKKFPEFKRCNGAPRLDKVDMTLRYDLLPGDGYVLIIADGWPDPDFDPNHQNDHVQLVRPDQSKPIVLPILAKEMFYNSKLTYSDFTKGYVLVPYTWRDHDVTTGGTWPRNQPIPIYLITSSGNVQTINVPLSWEYPSAVYPTHEGLLWVSNLATSGNSKQAGGWLVKDGKVIKLFDHLVDGAGVSPDGCKIAYQNNDHNPYTIEYVQVIDLCQTATKK